MKWRSRFADWVVEKEYRYLVVQFILYVIVFLCACTTVASISVIMM